jgi:hypothetical protein
LMAPTSERAPKRLFAVCYANRANLLDDPTDAT